VNQSTAAILDQNTANSLDPATLPPAFGHGTMVAGIVHLTAPTARIMPLKAFRGDGTANLSDILRAIYYATDNGARVINMSFSLLSYSLELDNAIRYAEHAGVTCVASNGNLGIALITQPAALNRVIAVGSTSNTDERSFFTSFGPPTWITAPGEGVITTYTGNNYAAAWGTSFSTPFVSGAAALALQIDSKANYSETSNWLTRAKELTPDLGHGRLDLYQALSSSSGTSGSSSGTSGSTPGGSGSSSQ
jgi:subtilisin family serine protease